ACAGGAGGGAARAVARIDEAVDRLIFVDGLRGAAHCCNSLNFALAYFPAPRPEERRVVRGSPSSCGASRKRRVSKGGLMLMRGSSCFETPRLHRRRAWTRFCLRSSSA